MPNIKTIVDEWEVRDLEDNSTINVAVLNNTEMGNKSLPGLQVICAGHTVNYEPYTTERWVYLAGKENKTEYFIEDGSWLVYEETYIRHSLLLGEKLKARIEIKVRSSAKPLIKEYELPFTLN